jgi:hypothetical protein
VTIFDQTSDVTPESSIITTQTKRGLEIDRTLPFFRECVLRSRTDAPFRIVRNQCESCCNEACLSAHPKYLEKKFQVRAHLQSYKGIFEILTLFQFLELVENCKQARDIVRGTSARVDNVQRDSFLAGLRGQLRVIRIATSF